MDAATEGAPAAVAKHTIDVHATILLLQAENGLRHRDYRRYRKYITRRLQKVRRVAGVTCGRGRLFVKKEITAENATTAEHLMVLLLNAERSWSYSMELKDAYTVEGQLKLKHLAVSRLSRAANWARQFRELCQQRADSQTTLEATAYSDWMEGLLLMERESWTEAVAKLSSAKAIYQELSKIGSLHDQDVFLGRLQEVDPPIRFCRFNAGSDSEPVDVDVFASSPDLSARFDEIRAKRAATDVSAKASSDDGFTVRFAGQAVPVLEADLRTRCSLVAVAVEKASRPVQGDMSNKARDKEFTAALVEVDAALGAVSKRSVGLTEAGSSGGARAAVAAGAGKVAEMKESLGMLRNYLSFQRLLLLFTKNKNVCRGLLADAPRCVGVELHRFTGDKKSPFDPAQEAAAAQRVHELAHILDQRMTLLKDMQSTPGVEAHDLLKMQLSSEEFVCRTLRACYIADCYVIERKWDQASALLDHADALALTAQEKYSNFRLAVDSTDSSENDSTAFVEAAAGLATEVESLEQVASGARARHTALSALLSSLPSDNTDSDNEEEEVGGDMGDADRQWSILSRPLRWIEPVSTTDTRRGKKTPVEVGGGSKTIVVDEIPSGFNAVPCKPVFFDIASNYIDFPDLDHRAGLAKKRRPRGDTADGADTQTSGGIVQNLFGWFSG